MCEKEETLLNNLEKRVTYLKHIEQHFADSDVQTEYFEKRLWRLIVEYMLREGYIDSTKQLISELNLEEFVDLDVFIELNEITKALKAKKCQPAIKW